MRGIFRLMGQIAFSLLALPVILILTVFQWICLLAVGLSSILFNMIGGIFIIAGFLSYMMGYEPVAMMWRMIAAGTGICLFPIVGEWITAQITCLNLLIRNRMIF